MAKKKNEVEPMFDIYCEFNPAYEIPIDGMIGEILDHIFLSAKVCPTDELKQNLKLWHVLRIKKHGVCACSIKSYVFRIKELKSEFSEDEIEKVLFYAYEQGWRGLEPKWYKNAMKQKEQQPQQRSETSQTNNIQQLFSKF